MRPSTVRALATGEQVARIGSKDMNDEIWLSLAQRSLVSAGRLRRAAWAVRQAAARVGSSGA